MAKELCSTSEGGAWGNKAPTREEGSEPGPWVEDQLWREREEGTQGDGDGDTGWSGAEALDELILRSAGLLRSRIITEDTGKGRITDDPCAPVLGFQFCPGFPTAEVTQVSQFVWPISWSLLGFSLSARIYGGTAVCHMVQFIFFNLDFYDEKSNTCSL